LNRDKSPILPTKEWLPEYSKPLVLAGPCSAESEDQLRTIARVLKDTGRVQLIRAGVWKPRTRPNSFEGMGKDALGWIANVQEEVGLPFTIEVANAEHVNLALAAGIKHLWIGARTTVNPFSVQEIADALVGQDVSVMVKNPLNPDLQLWLGAIERILAAGITKVVAIHRGFNTFQDHIFRNSPNWEIPIELKTLHPNLEIIVDPSHIAGQRSLIHEVSQKAMDLGFDGLMIETHPNPDEAMSDPKQQWPLDGFQSLLDSITLKQRHFQDSDSIDQLDQFRKLIDEIDHNLLMTIKRRLEIVDKIGQYKADYGVTVFQLERWREILQDRIAFGQSIDVDEALVKALWDELHKTSLKKQTDIARNRKS